MKIFISKGLLSLVLLLSFSFVFAQQQSITITGKITDDKNSPVQGVSVTEIDAEKRVIRGVSTDVNGNFSMRISDTRHKLSLSNIGYIAIEDLSINTRRVFNVKMTSSSKQMGDVVVVAQKRTDNGMLSITDRNSTIATAKISAKEMEEMQATSIDQALQGRLAGVDIAANSGDPGAGMQIRIRGTSSINSSNEPLIVVDGMPYETQIPSDFNFGTADDQGYATLLNIAPSDIKDITILKDGAATALWGSRAANGVLIINTKRGTRGKPTLSYTFKGTVSPKAKPIPMLNGKQYSNLIPEAYMNRNGIPLNTQSVNEFKFDPNDPYYFYNYGNNTNWVDAISRMGNTQDHNISMTGGGAKARYYASLGYLNQQGVTIGTDLSRISTRINLDYNVSDRITFKTDLSYTHSNNSRNYADNLRSVAYIKMPNMGIYEYDEYGNLTPVYYSPFANIQGQFLGVSGSNIRGTINPVAMAYSAVNKVTSDRIIPKFNLQYAIDPNIWTATFDVQFDINNTKSKSFLPQIATGRPWTENTVNISYDGDNDGFNVQTKSSLTYTPRINDSKHSFLGLLNVMTYDARSVSYQAQTTNSASSNLQDPSIPARANGTESKLASGTSQTRTRSALLNAQYGYDDKYMINAGLRGDANSRLSSANRYGLFPSLSTRWRISGEKFMTRFNKVVDDLSLRASYGRSGNAPKRDYTFYNTYSNLNWNYLGEAGVYSSNMELRNLRWETVIGQNVGVNLAMFKNKVSLDVEFYKNRTKDLFFQDLQIASENGFNDVDMNVGTMDNQGWEIALNTTPFKNKTWTIDFNFNISRNINVIREISEFYPVEKGNITSNGQYKTFMQVDNPFGSFYGFRYKGVYKDLDATVVRNDKGEPVLRPNGDVVYMRFNYPTVDYTFQPGDAMYEDINHDGTIDYRDIVFLGNSNPQFAGGFGLNVAYKSQWRLSTFFNFRYKYDIINGTEMRSTNMYGYDNQSTEVLQRWRKPGDVTDVPRALFATGYNWLGSSRYVEDGSFLRFRTVTLRYTFTKPTLEKMKIKNLSAYITAENIVTATRYTGQDPEISVRGSDPFRVATDNSMTPPVKMFTIGLTGSF
ncbi:SusC/RagA family TonB-linked outer membrane protein [Segetibacter sp. 3557_3]|uniref:SusC/RagA family TonB-linked outer membrane protein n=1 Tax=Segetibacter sp. 3557_3 TaxID=2547429 RepID=UPI00105914BD|nr:SusC/RagA family TonB-linked outer membrane protein [Segetibacter sp. 3557_3]TDH24261.1 SusC/RagA family TonB-linked outer membrane protein [Segetibacter sp. 3557_3]